MWVLAFDTTNEKGGVGIYRDDRSVASVPNEGPANTYSVALFDMVDRALAQAQLALRDVDLFAVAKGPGSFTGIRVGVAAAQGWAQAFGRPVKGISVLDAMVEAARPPTDWAVPILDARRGQLFAGFARRGGENGVYEAHGEAIVAEPDALRAQLEDFFSRQHAGASITCLARESDRKCQDLRASFPEPLVWDSIPGLLTDAMARLALRAWREGRLETPASLDALYVRRADAEIQSKKAEKHQP